MPDVTAQQPDPHARFVSDLHCGHQARVDVDLFAGPGGWDEAGRSLGITPVGIELDAAACATRAAAGHRTVRADVAAYPVAHLAGNVRGLIASPVCTTFSAAGKRAGNAVLEILAEGIRDALAGRRTRARRRREMAAALRRAWWPGLKMTRAERSAAIWKAVRSSSLVIEPARFIHACQPSGSRSSKCPPCCRCGRRTRRNYGRRATACGRASSTPRTTAWPRHGSAPSSSPAGFAACHGRNRRTTTPARATSCGARRGSAWPRRSDGVPLSGRRRRPPPAGSRGAAGSRSRRRPRGAHARAGGWALGPAHQPGPATRRQQADRRSAIRTRTRTRTYQQIRRPVGAAHIIRPAGRRAEEHGERKSRHA